MVGEFNDGSGEGQAILLRVFRVSLVCPEGNAFRQPHAGAEGGTQLPSFFGPVAEGFAEVFC